MTSSSLQSLIATCLVILPASAAIVTSAGSGAWTDGAVWSDSNPAGSGNDYVIGSGHRIESPSAATVTFPGDSLTVQSGGILEFYRANGGNTGLSVTATVPELTVAGGTLRSRVGFATGHATLDSAVDFDGGGTIEVGTTYGTYSHNFTLNGDITGDGSVNVFRTGQGSGRSIIFNGDVTGFTGNWTFSNTGSSETLNVTFNAGSGGWGSGDLTVGNYANLSLNGDFSSSTAALYFGVTGTSLNLNGDITLGTLVIDGNTLGEGSYDAADLGALGYGGSYGGTGTLTVVPEPRLLLLGALGLLGLPRRRQS